MENKTNSQNTTKPRHCRVFDVVHSPSKLILDNQTDLPMEDFLTLAKKVIQMGRISNNNKQFCFLTSFIIDWEEYHIVSDLNKKSDKLTFYKVPTQ